MAVLALGTLAACTSNDPGDPPTSSPHTASATPTLTPTPPPTPTPEAATPPERPDMSTVDAEAAKDLAVYFLRLYPYVYATGDVTEWKAVSHPECIFCSASSPTWRRWSPLGSTGKAGSPRSRP